MDDEHDPTKIRAATIKHSAPPPKEEGHISFTDLSTVCAAVWLLVIVFICKIFWILLN